MDEYKRGSDGLCVSRKGSNLVLRDTANNRDQNAQFCNRIGCNGRLNTAKGTQINYQEKAKFSRTSSRSSNGKELVGSSSRTPILPTNPRKSFPGPRKKLSSDPSETGSLPDVTEKIEKGVHESDKAVTSENRSIEIGSSSIPNTRSRRNFYQKSGIGKSDSPSGSPISLAAKSATQRTRTGAGGYGLRNLRCSSITDAVPTGSSTSDSSLTRQKGTVKRRISEGESSTSVKGKKTSGSPFEAKNPSNSAGISISDSRRTRSGISSPNPNYNIAPATIRTRRPFSNTRSRVANQVSRVRSLEIEPNAVNPQASEPVMPMDSTSSSSLSSMESPSSRSRSYGVTGISNDRLRSNRPASPAEIGSIRSSISRESFRRYNMDGIAEVLLALERIEQDEELTYEQLLVLETGLFLNGLNFYDQHRDMRLDIDDMSYEELLALEERMGSVSTALTEEALSECVKTIIYDSTSLKDTTLDLCGKQDDVKCSVCQEEFINGDEVGRLQCEHKYHLSCIYQWLRLKNWCPICKAPASSTSRLFE